MLRPPPQTVATVLLAALGALWAPSSAAFQVPKQPAQAKEAPPVPGQRPRSEDAPQTIQLTLGASIDLLLLDYAGAENVHATVGRGAGEAIALRPGPGVKFSSVVRGPTSPDDIATWAVPDALDPSLRENRTVLLRSGDSLSFVLPGARVGRLEVHLSPGQGWDLIRDLAVPGEARIPRATNRPMGTVVHPDSGLVIVRVQRIHDPKMASLMVHEIEQEMPLGSGQWTVVERLGRGEHEAKLEGLFGEPPLPPNAVARLRVRRGIEGESLSPAGPPVDIVKAGGNAGQRRDAAHRSVAQLIDTDFQVRLEASLALGLLGAEGREALSSGAKDTGDIGQAARDRLRALDEANSGGPDLALRLAEAARAAASGESPASAGPLAGAFGDVPPELIGADPLARAMGILRLLDASERGVRRIAPFTKEDGATGGGAMAGAGEPAAQDFDVARDCAIASGWAAAMGELDPDPTVRQLCEFLGQIRVQPSLGAFEAPTQGWFLGGASKGSYAEFEPFTNPRDPLPAHAVDLIYELSARKELGNRRVGPSLARIRAYLMAAHAGGDEVSIRPESGYHDYDADLVDLGLRLVERAVNEPRVSRKKELLGAVEALFPDPSLTYAAWRETSDRRWASPLGEPGLGSDSATERRQVRLIRADLAELEQVLLDLALDAGALGSAFRTDVDVLLPAGEYGRLDKRPHIIDVPSSGIRITPAEPGAKVLIHAGFRCMGAVDFVLEDVSVVHGAGQAITVMDGGHAVAVGSILKGKGRVVHISNGEVELFECDVLPAFGDPSQGTMLQLMGGGTFSARASSLRAGSLFIGQGGGDIWLDRCVLDAADRPLVQGQLGGRLITRESLLRGDGAGLMSVQQGMLAATVLQAAFQPLGRGGEGLTVSPGLFALTGSRDDAGKVEHFALEPLPVK